MEVRAESSSQLRRLEASTGWEDNRPHIVLISGKAGVGKSTFASTLSKVVREHEDANKQIIMRQPLAWGVKRTAMGMGWDREKDVKGRRLLQGIGRIGREYDPNMWVKIADQAICDTQYFYGSLEARLAYVWIDDWRFKNEIKWFLAKDYQFRIHTVRITAPNREILKGTPEALDISEVDLDDFTEYDFVIDNRGSLDELWASANSIYKHIQ